MKEGRAFSLLVAALLNRSWVRATLPTWNELIPWQRETETIYIATSLCDGRQECTFSFIEWLLRTSLWQSMNKHIYISNNSHHRFFIIRPLIRPACGIRKSSSRGGFGTSLLAHLKNGESSEAVENDIIVQEVVITMICATLSSFERNAKRKPELSSRLLRNSTVLNRVNSARKCGIDRRGERKWTKTESVCMTKESELTKIDEEVMWTENMPEAVQTVERSPLKLAYNWLY